MKTAISIPDPVFDSAEGLAHRLGLSRSELYVLALKSFMDRRLDDVVTKKLNEIYREAKADYDSALQSMQSRSLRRDKW